MPTTQRHDRAGLIGRLRREPQRFALTQALLVLERQLRRDGVSRERMFADHVAVRSSLSLAFPATEIERLDDAQPPPSTRPAQPPRLTLGTTALGIGGPGGALPSCYAEMFLSWQTAGRDQAARAFLDLFAHRATALFYEAWRKHRLALRFATDRRHEALPLLLSLAGLGGPGLQQRLRTDRGGVADDSLAFHAAALRARRVPADTLARLLARYFRVPVGIESFVGRHAHIPLEHQCALGRRPAGLGTDAVLGTRVWQRDLRLRLTLGPIPRERYRAFLPGGAVARALDAWLQLLLDVQFEVEVRLTLRAADVRGLRLDPAMPPALGWDSYLLTTPGSDDRSDAGYLFNALP